MLRVARLKPFRIMVLASALGCSFNVDSALRGVSGREPDAAEQPPSDEAGLADADLPDASEQDDGAPEDDASVPCATGDECTEDQICARHICALRCTTRRGCAELQLSEPLESRIVGDDRGVHYVTRSEVGETSLWSWDLASPPAKVVDLSSQPWNLVGSSDRYLYATTFDGLSYELGRWSIWLESPPEYESLASSNSPIAVWFTQGAVWWSLQSPAELWQMASTGAPSPTLMASAEHQGWLGGNSTSVFRAEGAPPYLDLIQDPLPALAPSRRLVSFSYHAPELPTPGVAVWADESVVFVMSSDRMQLLRIRLSDLTKELAAPTGVASRFTSGVFVGDRLFYGETYENGGAIGYMSSDSSWPFFATGGFDSNTLAIASEQVVFSDGEHIFVRSLNAPPWNIEDLM